MADADLSRRTPARGRTTGALRLATRAAHLDAEAAVDLEAACASPAALAALLGRLADGLEAVEDGIAARIAQDDVPPDLLAGWRRGARLRADARRLGGLALVPEPAPMPAWTPDEALGAWYVLEGARLGGPVIARAAAAALPAARGALPTLAGPGGGRATGARWRTFAGWLDAREVAEEDVVAGAREAFARVAAAVRGPDAVAVAT
jgi:heme oxygenase